MAVKEERALADGILPPFCVFLFGRGRVGGSCKTVSAKMLQTPQVLILICLQKSSHYYLSSHITEEKSRKKCREDNRENSLIYTTINSPSSRITLHWLKAFNAINFSVFSFSMLNKLIAVTFPDRHFFQPCAIIFWCLTSSYTFCWSWDSETLQVAQYSDNGLWDGSWLCWQSLVRWQHHVPLWSHPGERR